MWRIVESIVVESYLYLWLSLITYHSHCLIIEGYPHLSSNHFNFDDSLVVDIDSNIVKHGVDNIVVCMIRSRAVSMSEYAVSM